MKLCVVPSSMLQSSTLQATPYVRGTLSEIRAAWRAQGGPVAVWILENLERKEQELLPLQRKVRAAREVLR